MNGVVTDAETVDAEIIQAEAERAITIIEKLLIELNIPTRFAILV